MDRTEKYIENLSSMGNVQTSVGKTYDSENAPLVAVSVKLFWEWEVSPFLYKLYPVVAAPIRCWSIITVEVMSFHEIQGHSES